MTFPSGNQSGDSVGENTIHYDTVKLNMINELAVIFKTQKKINVMTKEPA